MKKILLIEDDLEFAQLIVEFLKIKDIVVEVDDNPFNALSLDLNEYSLVLLDLGLPGIDGLEVCENFRKKSKVPIIISSARGSVFDKVLGLQKGADDYLPKPYDPDELYARIMSLLRRTNNMQDSQSICDFAIDERFMDIYFKGKSLDLTNAEFEVLKELIKHKTEVVSKEQLIFASSSIESSDGKSLEMIISKIRQKIKVYSEDKYIIAIRGKGYKIVC